MWTGGQERAEGGAPRGATGSAVARGEMPWELPEEEEQQQQEDEEEQQQQQEDEEEEEVEEDEEHCSRVNWAQILPPHLPVCGTGRGLAMVPMEHDAVDAEARAEMAALRAWGRKERDAFAAVMLGVARRAEKSCELTNFHRVAQGLCSRGFHRTTAEAVLYYYGSFKHDDERYAKLKALKNKRRVAWQNRELMDEVWNDVRPALKSSRASAAGEEQDQNEVAVRAEVAIESEAVQSSAEEQQAEHAQAAAAADESQTESECSEDDAYNFGHFDGEDDVENNVPSSSQGSSNQLHSSDSRKRRLQLVAERGVDDCFKEMVALGTAYLRRRALKRQRN